ncbi:transposase [Oceanobacillus bengalensis]|uniref:Transposase n=1 Tax=Oceanobacillus bengalensis TaxID=1435466 RepID=A0A494YRT7_9BACI|nr:transposase [Oceanobacillus bengalensis]
MVLEDNVPYTDHDHLSKALIKTFLHEFTEAFFPQINQQLDFSTVKFLEQEVYTDLLVGKKRIIDILAEVKLKENDQLTLLHIEPQSTYQREFHERMFTYYSHLYLKHRIPIIPIAVFTYNNKADVPKSFTMEAPDKVSEFNYLQLHLIKLNWRAFIESDNPAAAALLSKMGYRDDERVQVKLEFLKMVSRIKLNEAKVELVIGFFESYLKLNEKEEKQLREEIANLPKDEAEGVLRLPNSFYERGRKEGREEERKLLAKRLLLKGMSIEDIADVTGFSRDEIEELENSRSSK